MVRLRDRGRNPDGTRRTFKNNKKTYKKTSREFSNSQKEGYGYIAKNPSKYEIRAPQIGSPSPTTPDSNVIDTTLPETPRKEDIRAPRLPGEFHAPTTQPAQNNVRREAEEGAGQATVTRTGTIPYTLKNKDKPVSQVVDELVKYQRQLGLSGLDNLTVESFLKANPQFSSEEDIISGGTELNLPQETATELPTSSEPRVRDTYDIQIDEENPERFSINWELPVQARPAMAINQFLSDYRSQLQSSGGDTLVNNFNNNFSKLGLRRFIAFNPHLKGIEMIPAGTRVYFPSDNEIIPATVSTSESAGSASADDTSTIDDTDQQTELSDKERTSQQQINTVIPEQVSLVSNQEISDARGLIASARSNLQNLLRQRDNVYNDVREQTGGFASSSKIQALSEQKMVYINSKIKTATDMMNSAAQAYGNLLEARKLDLMYGGVKPIGTSEIGGKEYQIFADRNGNVYHKYIGQATKAGSGGELKTNSENEYIRILPDGTVIPVLDSDGNPVIAPAQARGANTRSYVLEADGKRHIVTVDALGNELARIEIGTAAKPVGASTVTVGGVSVPRDPKTGLGIIDNYKVFSRNDVLSKIAAFRHTKPGQASDAEKRLDRYLKQNATNINKVLSSIGIDTKVGYRGLGPLSRPDISEEEVEAIIAYMEYEQNRVINYFGKDQGRTSHSAYNQIARIIGSKLIPDLGVSDRVKEGTEGTDGDKKDGEDR